MLHRLPAEAIQPVIDAFAAPVLVIDVGPRDGFRYLAVNAALTAISGLGVAAVAGKAPEDCLPGERAEEARRRYAHCVRSGREEAYEDTPELPSGRTQWRTVLTPLFDDRGEQVVRLLGTALEIGVPGETRLLRESREHLALAAETARGGTWRLDLDTGRFDTSPELNRLLGESEDFEPTLEAWCARIHPEDRPSCFADDPSADDPWAADPATHVTHLRLRHRSQGYRFVRCSWRRISARSGGQRSILGVVIDVTATERADRRLVDAVDSMADGLALYDAEDRLVLCNQRYREMYGSGADLLFSGARYEDIVREGARCGDYEGGGEDLDAWVAAVVAKHRRGHAAYEVRTRDGRWLDVHTRRTGAGDIVVIRRDITRRKLAEIAACDSAARLETLFATATECLVTIDANGAITLCNEAGAKLFGYELDELVGRNVSVLMPAPERDRHDGHLRRYLAGGPARIIGVGREVEGQRKDGSVFPLRLSVGECSHFGERMFIGVLHDLSPQKQAEAALQRHMAQLHRANRDLEDFAYVASHDLRAPLRAVDMLTEWIAEDLSHGNLEEALTNLGLVRGRVRRLDRLLEDLLAYSRIGHCDDAVEPIETAALVAETVDLIAPPPGFEVVCVSAIPSIQGQRTPLATVLRNLISNAIKHHDRGTGRIEIAAKLQGDWVEFTVQDDGPGIEPRFRDKVFGMFKTLRSRDDVEGSGMGLTFVQRIVDLHGGSIAIEDPLDGRRGARLRFTWPAAPKADALARAA